MIGLPFGRRLAENLMTDTCRITRDGIPVLNESTGNYTSTPVVIYEGKCRLKLNSTVVSNVDAQSQLFAVQSPQLSIPVEGTGTVKPNDDVLMLSSGTDADVVGLVLRVSGVFFQTNATARRLPVEVLS